MLVDPQPNFFLYLAGWRTFSADFRLAAFFPADFRPAIIFPRIRLKFGGWGLYVSIQALNLVKYTYRKTRVYTSYHQLRFCPTVCP